MNIFPSCTTCPPASTLCRSASPLGIDYPLLQQYSSQQKYEDILERLHQYCGFPIILAQLGDTLATRACSNDPCFIPTLFEFLRINYVEELLPRKNIVTPKEKTVAIIGSGPAGLQAALSLHRYGYDITVYEAAPQAGITLLSSPVQESSSASPEFSPALPEDVLKQILQKLEEMGIRFMVSSPMGQAELALLRKDFDAVVCACGKGAVLPAKNGAHVEGNLFGAGTCLKNQKLMNALQAMQSGKNTAEAVYHFLG